MSTCVVTGAAGFIGSHLSEALVALGHDVVAVDAFTDHYPRAAKERNAAALKAHDRVRFLEIDLAAADLAQAVEGADVVFHLAARAGLQGWDVFDTYLECNLVATQRLLEASRDASVGHFLHASTSSVYGRVAECGEDGQVAPCSPYGVTKVAAEELCRAYGRMFDVPLTILRFFSVYGPRQRPDMGYHIFIRSLLRGEPIFVHGDGEQSRSNTFIEDCVAGVLAAWRNPDASVGEVFNLGGGDVVTVNQALEVLQELTGRVAEISHTDPRAGDQRRTRADFSKAERLLGYAPGTGLRAGLERQVAWQRSLVGSED